MRAEEPRLFAAIALIVVMGLAFAGLDTSVRWIGPALPLVVVLGWRYATQAGLMAIWLGAGGRRMRPLHWRFQLLRGVLLIATSAFAFLGLQAMPVAAFTAIIMLSPVLVTLLAARVLHEQVTAGRWALVALAFAGALVVIRPGSGLFGWGAVYALAAVCTNASFQTLTRRMQAIDDPLVTHFWTGAIGTAALLPLWLAVDASSALAVLSPRQWGVLVLLGLLGTGAHLLLILALRLAPASALMPFTYSQIASAVLIGWFVFGDLPDSAGWLGMTMIAASGVLSAWLNLRGRWLPLRR